MVVQKDLVSEITSLGHLFSDRSTNRNPLVGCEQELVQFCWSGKELGNWSSSQVPGTCCCPGTTLGKRLICTESRTQQSPCVHCTVTHVPRGHIIAHPVLRTKQGPIVQSEKQAMRGSDVPEVT